MQADIRERERERERNSLVLNMACGQLFITILCHYFFYLRNVGDKLMKIDS